MCTSKCKIINKILFYILNVNYKPSKMIFGKYNSDNIASIFTTYNKLNK